MAEACQPATKPTSLPDGPGRPLVSIL